MLNSEQEKIVEELTQEAEANDWSKEQIIEALKEKGIVSEESVQELNFDEMENVAGGKREIFRTCLDSLWNKQASIEEQINNGPRARRIIK